MPGNPSYGEMESTTKPKYVTPKKKKKKTTTKKKKK